MVSASTLIGPFEFDRALATRPLLTARSQVNNGRVASARSNSNGPIRVEAEFPLLTARSQASEESRRGEF